MKEQKVPDTPYKGLVPYTEEDARFFFGRKAEDEVITANLMAARLTVLYGPSGVGKSSVLRAGLANDLKELARQNLDTYKVPEFAVVVFRSWRDDPVEGLLTQIEEAVAQALNVKTIDPALRSSSFTETLRNWTKLLQKDEQEGELFIILDQFEEYFLYHPNDNGNFAMEFPRAVNDSSLRVNFLVSIREDWLARLDRFKGQIPNLFDNYLRIEHLNRYAATDAIEMPIEQYNKLQKNEPRISLEPGLVGEILSQLAALADRVGLIEAGRGAALSSRQTEEDARIQTSYLQLVMTRLWDAENERWEKEKPTGTRVIRSETFKQLGDAKRILQTHLEKVMSNLDAREQEVASRAFPHLVTAFGTKIASPVSGLARLTRLNEAEIEGVLQKLSDKSNSILTTVASPPNQPEGSWYEVFHDVLAPALLDWKIQYDQEREIALAKDLAERQRKQAEEKARTDEKLKSGSRMRWLAVGLAVAALFGLATAVFATSQLRRANEQSRIAQMEKTKADEAREKAVAAEAEAHKQTQIAEGRVQEVQKAKDEAIAAKDLSEKERRRAEDQAQIAAAAKRNAEQATSDLKKQASLLAVQKAEADLLRTEADDQKQQVLAQLKIANDEKAKADDARKDAEKERDRAVNAILVDKLNGEASVLVDKRGEENLKGASQKYEEVLGLYDKLKTPERKGPTYINLGQVQYQLKDYSAAVGSFSQALTTFSTDANRDDSQLVTIHLGLARSYEAQKKTVEAVAAYRSALDIQKKLLKPDDDHLINTQTSLATLERELGHFPEARELLDAVLAAKKVRSPIVLNDLAVVNEALGDNAKAEILYKEALETWNKMFTGPESDVAFDPRTSFYASRYLTPYLETSAGLARIYSAKSRDTEAMALYARARQVWVVATQSNIFSSPTLVTLQIAENSGLYAKMLDNYAGLLRKANNPKVAAQVESEAIKIRLKAKPKTSS